MRQERRWEKPSTPDDPEVVAWVRAFITQMTTPPEHLATAPPAQTAAR